MRRFTLSLPAAPSDAKALSLFLYRVKRIHLFVTCLTVSISIGLQNTSLPHFASHISLAIFISVKLDWNLTEVISDYSWTILPSFLLILPHRWQSEKTDICLSLSMKSVLEMSLTLVLSADRYFILFPPLLKKKVIWQTDKTVGGLACNQQSVVLQSLRGLQIP